MHSPGRRASLQLPMAPLMPDKHTYTHSPVTFLNGLSVKAYTLTPVTCTCRLRRHPGLLSGLVTHRLL